jgi:hypothetical protein
MTDSTLGDLLFLIRAEFLEIPGLQLTQRQIEHLWGIDSHMADAILRSLVEAHVLTRTPAGAYTHRRYHGLLPASTSRFWQVRPGDRVN